MHNESSIIIVMMKMTVIVPNSKFVAYLHSSTTHTLTSLVSTSAWKCELDNIHAIISCYKQLDSKTDSMDFPHVTENILALRSASGTAI